MGIEVTDSNFTKEIVESDIPVLVDFWATWCMPCKMVEPILEALEREYKNKIKLCKVNVDEAPKIAMKYEIISIPTICLFIKGEIKEKIVGALPKDDIENMIKPYVN